MKVLIRPLAVAASVLALSTLAACVAPAYYQQPDYPYQSRPMSSPGPSVEYGSVTNIEVFQTQGGGAPVTGGGAVVGGVVGGVLGNQVGRGVGRGAATVLGALGGALVGNAIEANNSAPRAYQSFRLSIQTDGGGFRIFDVPSIGDLRIGDRVVIDRGQISRY